MKPCSNAAFDAATHFTCDPEADRYSAHSPGEAIAEFFDDDPATWPGAITVYAYSVVEPELDADDVLERVLEGLDDEHRCYDWSVPTVPTPGMLAAACAFCAAVLAEYEGQTAEYVGKRDFTAADFPAPDLTEKKP